VAWSWPQSKWEIPVPRDEWHAVVRVSVTLAEESLHISIHAYGHRTNDREGRHRGHVYYPAFFGEAPRQSITPEWVNGVLAREIETAIMAARSFRDEDLSEEALPEHYKQPEFYEGMAGYFASTLERCGK
jgi:hypothetical protein